MAIRYGLILRIIFMNGCFVLCTWQVVSYIKMYLQFGTMVDIYLELAKRIEVPSFTLCKVKYSYHKDIFCNMTQNQTCDYKSASELIVEAKKMLVDFNVETLSTLESQITETYLNQFDSVDWKPLQLPEANIFWTNRTCYSFNTFWDRPDFKNLTFDSSYTFHGDLKFNPPGSSISLRELDLLEIYIHSPEEIPFRAVGRVGLRPGLTSHIRMTLKKLKLLEPPYKTLCRNYTKDWYNNGGKGPLSKENCLIECYWNISQQNCGCISIQLPILLHANKCIGNTEQHNCVDFKSKEVKECEKQCRSDCVIKTYDFIPTDDIYYQSWGNNAEQIKELVFKCSLGHFQIMHYEHNPQIKDIEILGYVGGYLSIWLNLSIPSIFHYFSIVLLYMHHLINKLKQRGNINLRANTNT